MNKATLKVQFTKAATGNIFWMFNGDGGGPSALRIKNFTEAKRQKRILEGLVKDGVDKKTGHLLACSIDLGFKDILFLEKITRSFFENKDGVPSDKAIGLLDTIEGIEALEDSTELKVEKIDELAKEKPEEE